MEYWERWPLHQWVCIYCRHSRFIQKCFRILAFEYSWPHYEKFSQSHRFCKAVVKVLLGSKIWNSVVLRNGLKKKLIFDSQVWSPPQTSGVKQIDRDQWHKCVCQVHHNLILMWRQRAKWLFSDWEFHSNELEQRVCCCWRLWKQAQSVQNVKDLDSYPTEEANTQPSSHTPVRLVSFSVLPSSIPAPGFSWYSLFETVLAHHGSLYFLVSVAIVCWL